jgi:hypothetical protein
VSKLRIKKSPKDSYNGLGQPAKTIENTGGLGDVISQYHTWADIEIDSET